MLNIFYTTEFWAAVLGGLFSLSGSSVASWVQHRLGSKERSRFALRFFRDQAVHFSSVVADIEHHFNVRGEIWLEYINDIDASYSVIMRNVEHLTFIEKEDDRNYLRNHFSNVYNMSKRSEYWQKEFYKNIEKRKENATDNLKEIAENDAALVVNKQQMKDCVLELKRLRLSTPAIIAPTVTANA